MMNRTLFSIALLGICINAHAIEPCLSSAANEFSIPPKLLDALRQENLPPRNARLAALEFGPMGLAESAIQAAEHGVGIEADIAKRDSCQNYRAAAWFLSEKRKNAGGDLWKGVARYYVGDHATKHGQEIASMYVARIKKISGEF